MALYATKAYTGNGSTVEYSIGFEFLSEDHITVTLAGVAKVLGTDYTVNKATGKITFTTAPGSGVAIRFRRVTPRDTLGRYVDFVAGSGLTEKDLDDAVLYALFISQEILDTPIEERSVLPLSLTDATRFMATSFATATGTSTAFAVTLDPVPLAYVTGMFVSFKAHTTATYPLTLNVNGLGAKGVKVQGGNPVTNAIVASRTYFCIYDGTNFELMNPSVVATLTGPLSATLDCSGHNLQMSTNTGVIDNNSNELLRFGVTASAVNNVRIANAATGNNPVVSSEGNDTNIGLTLTPKGTGIVNVTSNLTATSLTSSGNITASGNISGVNITASGTPTLGGLTYPTSDGTSGQTLVTNGSGTLSFANASDVVLLNTTTIAGTPSTVDFTSLMTTGYSMYRFVLMDVRPSANAVLWLRVSADNGSTWISSAGAYKWCYLSYRSTSGYSANGSGGDTKISTDFTIQTGSGRGMFGEIVVTGSSTGVNGINFQLSGNSNTDQFLTLQGSGAYVSSHANQSFNALQLLLSTSTFAAGIIKVYGYK